VTRIVYQGSFFDVTREEVRLPNGRDASLEVVRHPGASAIVPFLGDDEVLLIRQYRHAVAGTIYEVPAGKLDPGEQPEACAARELEEETGYRAGRLAYLSTIMTTPGFTDERIHLYAAAELQPSQQQLDADEVIDLVPMSLGQALDLIWAGEIPDGKSALALLHAARLVGRLG